MDQTDVAVYSGIIAAPSFCVLLKKVTGWSLWAIVPVGAVGGFFGTAIAVYILIGIIGKRAERRKNEKDK
jgi:hypothetical protein